LEVCGQGQVAVTAQTPEALAGIPVMVAHGLLRDHVPLELLVRAGLVVAAVLAQMLQLYGLVRLVE
jgi:hypothetical protein